MNRKILEAYYIINYKSVNNYINKSLLQPLLMLGLLITVNARICK